MTLDELLQSIPTFEELRELWLVFNSELKDRLEQAQPIYNHQVSPVVLTNGQFALCADLLSEIDGIYKATFDVLDKSFFDKVQVIGTTEFQSLLPIPAEE
jgi:hypothetical protein